ncbi:MAG: glutamate-cysteine ligase family protein, partial [Methanoregula sp.]
MTIGTEHEYSVNDEHFTALPVSDQIIKSICGSFESEILFGEVKLGKELQKTVLEFLPRVPASGPAALETMLMAGIRKFYTIFPARYHLLGLGMHPTVTLDRIAVWDHDEGEYYETYDRLFNIRQHGWLNIQALQVNLSYAGEKDLLMQYNRIRTLIPYLIALTASSPMVEGRLTGAMDNRLLYYRENQKEIPQICNGIIPERIKSVSE